MQGLRRHVILPLYCPSYYSSLTICRHRRYVLHSIRTVNRMSVINEFPVWGLLPKKETGVTQFLSRYPEYDGRGIVIAVFDSGVDPGAAGLQTTSDGKVKVIERHDFSGAGDVDTSTIVEAVDGEIKGLTGRKLKIPGNWNNPSNKYHIGVKNAFDLYPKELLERIKNHRKEKLWDPLHKTAVAEANKELHVIEEYENNSSNQNSNGLEALEKKNLEAKISVLGSIEKKFKDLGPVYDCVVFHDGTMWRACLDTSEQGDLEKASLLGEYTLCHTYATLTKDDQLNYTINVHNDGNLLEIVSMCSSHGTHVASIAAAYFPDEPEKNGVAPGAQIISCTIGDNRLDTMETGSAIVRAMIRVMQNKERPVHVINMSYAEHAKWTCSGRLCELISEVVNKHDVIWVASAGNQGPALCTISTPPDVSTNSVIGVGAYVSPEMMIAEYSLREKLPGSPYTWSSRGPTVDGDVGITVCAPGGAITSVPTYTLNGSKLMNGTSMASPHVCGAVAVLLSGMEQRNLKYSSHSVKRALQNSAMFLQNTDPFAQGSGLLQVEKAFEYLSSYSNTKERDVRFSVQCGPVGTKGIHMRNVLEDKPREFSIQIKPEFFDDCEPDEKLKFNLKLALVCSEPWVQIPSHLDLVNSSRTIFVRVDPTSLPEGVHCTSIRAYDVSDPDKGALFSVQVTVVKPTKMKNKEHELSYNNVIFQPNTINRHFILVPPKATWAVLKLKSNESGKTGKFLIHSVQLKPKTICKHLQYYKFLSMNYESEFIDAFPVRGDLVLELVIAKYWDSYGDISMDYSLQFHGIRPDTPSVTMHAADGIHSIEVHCGAKPDKILPVVTLKQHVLSVRPSDSTITALTSPRDIIPPSRYIYENVLTYNFHINKGCEIVPFSPMLSDVLYESEFESQLWMLFDANKQLLASGDAYPQKYVVKVEKGDYVLRMHVRHEKKDLLEKLSDMPLSVAQKLSNSINMDVYLTQSEAMICGKKMSREVLPRDEQILPMYIAPLAGEKVTKLSSTGQYLTGSITYAKDELGKSADSYPFKYILTEPGKKNKNSKNKKEKTKYEEYIETVTETKIEWLGKLEPGKAADALYEELKASNPDNLAVHSAMLQCLEPPELDKGFLLPFISEMPDATKRDEIIERSKNIIAVADVVINAVDKNQLLAYTGMCNDPASDASNVKTQMEKQKTALIDAYSRKGCALCRLHFLESAVDNIGDKEHKGPEIDNINNIWKELHKFSDPNDMKVIYFMMWHSAVLNHYGRLAKYLQKLQEEKLSMAVENKLIEVYKKLNWKHCEKFLSSWIPLKYPTSYRLF